MKDEMESFQSAGLRHAIKLTSGEEIEGYILSCEADGLSFGHGGPLAPEEDDWIPYSQIDLNGLFYYCSEQKKYLKWESKS